MRKRGASGGGTLRSGELQFEQRSTGIASSRSQWPRAAHSGLTHCTVRPGRNVIHPPIVERNSSGRVERFRAAIPVLNIEKSGEILRGSA